MSFRDILRTAGYTLLTFSLVVALALIAKNDDIFLDKDVVAEEDTVNPNYNAENVTNESDTYEYLTDYYMESDVWEDNYEEPTDRIGPLDKNDEYFTDSSNEAQENASSISLD